METRNSIIRIKKRSWLSLVELSGMRGKSEKVCGRGISNPERCDGNGAKFNGGSLGSLFFRKTWESVSIFISYDYWGEGVI